MKKLSHPRTFTLPISRPLSVFIADPEGAPEVRPKNGNAKTGFSRKVVTAGWAKVQDYRFTDRQTYRRLMGSADYWRDGLFGDCIANYGSERNPYRPGTTFEVDGWRYTFAATDVDAQPEMAAEAAATPPGASPYVFAAPAVGSTFRRVLLTATRLDGRAPQHPYFEYVYGATLTPIKDSRYGSCGTAPNQLDHITVNPSETVSAYLCTAKPASAGLGEMWVVGDPETRLPLRYVASS